MWLLVSFLVLKHLAEEERAGCFTSMLLLLSCGCWSFCVTPCGAVVCLWYVYVTFPGHTRLLLEIFNVALVLTFSSKLTNYTIYLFVFVLLYADGPFVFGTDEK